MSLHAMISDVLVMPGNSNMFGNQIYAYNDQISREFHQSILSDTQPASPSYCHEVSFEHFIPPEEQMSSPSLMSTSPNDNGNSYSKKDKSRKLRSTKSPASEEEESPENKSRRRREQNRIAQRVFRERKDKYIHNLESHIKLLDASNKDLQASYRQSTNQINALYTQLLETQGELDYWRCLAQPSTPPTTIHSTTSSDNTPTISVVDSLFLQGRHHLPVMSDMQLQRGRFT